MSDGRHQPIRAIQPIGMRVLVRVLPGDARTSAGLYVPASAANKEGGSQALYGEVIEVARAEPVATEELSGVNVSGIPHGAKILFAPDSGVRVPWDDGLRLVETRDVLAVVDEIQADAAH